MFIGTSGYTYSNWYGKFYPKDIPKSKWLDYYANYFNSLELNSTFYHIPKKSTINNWKYKLKKLNLNLSIKANMQITHKFKLKNIKLANEFLTLLVPLKKYLGVVLFQLPPNLKYDFNLLEEFIKSLDKNFKIAIEFRNRHWYNDKVYNLLKSNKIILVWHDFNQPFVLEKTNRFTYIRFHGFNGKYKGSYPDEFLETIKNHTKQGFCYFNNTDDLSAIKDALRFKEIIE